MPRPTRICGPSASTATRAICSRCKTRSPSRIAVTLNLELVTAEAARPTENPDALDYIFRGRAAMLKPPSRDSYARRSVCSSAPWRSIRGPSRRRAFGGCARGPRADGLTDSAAADIARAEVLAEQALAASPRSPLAHFAKGHVLRAQRRYEEAIPEYETALASNRNWVGALWLSASASSSPAR